MGYHSVYINAEYFRGLGPRFDSVFDKVDEGLNYADSTNSVFTGMDFFAALKMGLRAVPHEVRYDIDSITTVLTTTDTDMKNKALSIIGVDVVNTVASGGTINSGYFDMEPLLLEPRHLQTTEYGYTTDEKGNQIYDHPDILERYLYRNQGSAYPNSITGTCGLCSCANILRMAGVDYNEQQIVDYALQHGLCDNDSNRPSGNGGTGPDDRQKILEAFGIQTHTVTVTLNDSGEADQQTINDLAGFVENGQGVIISVNANELNSNYGNGRHAIVVTSVTRDPDGNILGFNICDSNSGMPSYYSASTIRQALSGNDMNVTDYPIR